MSVHPLVISPDKPWLAPLAGFSDLPFRLLCREHGCAVAVTEMVSAKGLVYDSPGTRELLQTTHEDSPLVVQIFGSEEPFLLQAIERLQTAGFRYFDLNCGCPVRKVAKTGSGAALLKDPSHLLRLAASLVRVVDPQCMGFKIRLGWGANDRVYLPLAQALEQLGAGWITLHPRTGAQGFTGHADWSHLATLKKAVSVPILASGDLFLPEDGARCVEQTGVDGLMFARGALSDPAIFARYLAIRAKGAAATKSHQDAISLIRRLSHLYNRENMDKAGLLKMRTLAPRFLKGLPGARNLRRDIVFCTSWDQLFELLEHNPEHSKDEDQ